MRIHTGIQRLRWGRHQNYGRPRRPTPLWCLAGYRYFETASLTSRSSTPVPARKAATAGRSPWTLATYSVHSARAAAADCVADADDDEPKRTEEQSNQGVPLGVQRPGDEDEEALDDVGHERPAAHLEHADLMQLRTTR